MVIEWYVLPVFFSFLYEIRDFGLHTIFKHENVDVYTRTTKILSGSWFIGQKWVLACFLILLHIFLGNKFKLTTHFSTNVFDFKKVKTLCRIKVVISVFLNHFRFSTSGAFQRQIFS